ncbi:PREDICTED: uncharacterized protein LOC109591294 isoform X3 [Amphimedon queenslandica]|uniref:Uncharacterized protein n=1 Tax=Amphimedon queenslandica TaxID=400682 RepID=A0AAN0JZG7_AMPQE|nr:PREDICTED: uncharacterized protein LOC109591294 isoform X3 [Amphimedon queenslandica]|eukprot:XP_019862616.1 PREDICTED: uncharacterized protein LOC109591294 isoform X3 [Amphimedon queenslandica]
MCLGEYSVLRASDDDDDTPPPVPAYNPNGGQEYSELKREGENKGQQGLSTGATGLYSTINKNTNNQVLVDESDHKPVYADLAIAAKGKRPQAAPTQEQPVVYASVNNKSVPPPIPPPAAPHKVLYADLSIAGGKRTSKNKPPTEERVVYAAVNGDRNFTTQSNQKTIFTFKIIKSRFNKFLKLLQVKLGQKYMVLGTND